MQDRVNKINGTYSRYRSPCLELASRILPSLKEAEACTSGVLLHAKESIANGDKSIPSVIILRSARELALERSAFVRTTDKKSDLTLVLDEMKEAVPSVRQLDTTLEDSSPKDVINAFLSSLTKRTRKIFVRRYWYFSTISEISKELHLSENRICTALARSRKKLRWYLEKNGGQYTDEKRLILALGLIRGKYIDESDPTVEAYRRVRSLTVKALAAACACVMISALNLWLFLPLKPEAPDISMYEGSEYYSVIEKINSFYTKYPEYKNNYLRIVNTAAKILNGEMKSSNVYVSYKTYSSAYHETAESRRNGITKGNVLLKNEKYAFRLTHDLKIEIYTLEGESSSRIKTLSIQPPEGYTLDLEHTPFRTMYLSKGGSTLTVLLPCCLTEDAKERNYILAFNIDVADPKKATDLYACTEKLLYHQGAV